MTTTSQRLLQAGDLGVDYSGLRKRPRTLIHNGALFKCRYSAGVGNKESAVQWKLCEPKELVNAAAVGEDTIANCEWYESRITEGEAAGSADGAADLAFWRARSLAKGASIYVSWDQDPLREHWDAAIAYLKAFDAALAGHYHVDCYAGTPFLRHALQLGVIRFGWRPNAGAWSGDGLPYQPKTRTKRQRAALVQRALTATPAHIWQTGNYWFDREADEDMVLRGPVGSHFDALHADNPKPTPKPKPKPKPRPKPVQGAHRLVSDNGEHVYSVDDTGQLLRDGQPFPGAAAAKGA